MFSELKFIFRRLGKAPGFVAAVLATLGLCIGVNLTIFAVIESVMLRPLPFPAADQLVTIFNRFPKSGIDRANVSLNNYYERRGNIPSLSAIALYQPDTAMIGENGATRREEVMKISPEYFATLGMGPTIGRGFTDEEMTPPADNVAVLSDSYWRQYFSGDPGVLGQTIRVDGVTKRIIGILPSRFSFLSSGAQIFLPRSSDPKDRGVDRRYWGDAGQMIARLRPGATLADAQSQIDADNAAHAAESPLASVAAAAGFQSVVAPLRADHIRSIRPTLLLMQAGALFLLVVGGVNVVNLLLIRASGRAREFAVRQSMGANWRHVVGEVTLETVVLTSGGGLLGIAVGALGIRLLAVLGASHLPLGAHIAVDGWVAGVAMLGAVLLGVAIAGPIGWLNLRRHLGSALKLESRGGTTNRAAQRLRNGFIIVQIALAFVLLTGAGLLGISLQRAMAIPPGFRPDHIITGQVSLPRETYRDSSAHLGFVTRLLEKCRHESGILALGVITDLPLQVVGSTEDVTIPGYAPKAGTPPAINNLFGVSGDYFAAIGIPLRAGRFLEEADSRRQERVCVVDENFARRYWPQGGAIGQRFIENRLADNHAVSPVTIVGVVGAVKQSALTESHPLDAIYLPYRDLAGPISIVARTNLPPESFSAAIRNDVQAIDSGLAVEKLQTMDDRMSDSLNGLRSPALLTSIFSGIALLLAGVGIYGVLSYAVAQRRREIGVRSAIGARPAQIYRQFLFIGVRLLACGLVGGFLGAWLVRQAMQSLLFDIPAFPLAALTGTTAIVGAVVLAACLIPSRRAAHISPLEALADD